MGDLLGVLVGACLGHVVGGDGARGGGARPVARGAVRAERVSVVAGTTGEPIGLASHESVLRLVGGPAGTAEPGMVRQRLADTSVAIDGRIVDPVTVTSMLTSANGRMVFARSTADR